MDTHSALYNRCKTRLAQLREIAPRQTVTLEEKLKENGITRREFMTWSASVTALLALPLPFTSLVSEAAELADRVPLIWLHMAECTGCSESLIRTDTPNLDSLIFDHISLNIMKPLWLHQAGKLKKI